MKLYHSPAACSQAVLIALTEAQLSVEVLKVDLATHRVADGRDYYEINPRGYVPLIEFEDGSRRSEVVALLHHIGDSAPASGLMPAFGTAARLDVVTWLAFVSSELHKVFSPWLWHKETADSTRKACREKIVARFAELDAHLAGREFLVGDTFTAADAYLFSIASWAPMMGMKMDTWPNLRDYLARIASRPAVREVLRADGLLKA